MFQDFIQKNVISFSAWYTINHETLAILWLNPHIVQVLKITVDS